MLENILLFAVALLQLYTLVIIAWAVVNMLVSFNVINRFQPVVQKILKALNAACMPVIKPVQKRLPSMGGLDLSPIVVILLIGLIQNLIVCYINGLNFIVPFVTFINTIISLYSICIIMWAVLSMLVSFGIVNKYQPIVQQLSYALDRICEPAMRPLRKMLPDLGGFDIAPIIVLFALNFLSNTLNKIAFSFH